MTRCIEAFASAGSDLAETPEARARQLELAHIAAKYVERITADEYEEGAEPRHALHHATACRLDIEIQLARAREAAKPVDKPAEGR